MASAATRQISPKRTCFDEDPTDQTPTTAPIAKKANAICIGSVLPKKPHCIAPPRDSHHHPEVPSTIYKIEIFCVDQKKTSQDDRI
eukprot:4317195-Ditylum_brightwellii.AAC.1